jgi:hypothetical protein
MGENKRRFAAERQIRLPLKKTGNCRDEGYIVLTGQLAKMGNSII